MYQKPKAVYYCRVSTDDESQASSIMNQKNEAVKVIEDNQWQLTDGYIEMKTAYLIQNIE